MHIERVFLRNFRCFGPEQRLLGVTGEQRRLRRRDFHVPSDEKGALTERQIELEAVLAFPELDGGIATTSMPECFQHMAADDNRHKPGNPEGLATFFVALSRAKQRRCSCSVRRSAARPRWLTSISCWPMLLCRRSPYRRSRRALRMRPRHVWPCNRL